MKLAVLTTEDALLVEAIVLTISQIGMIISVVVLKQDIMLKSGIGWIVFDLGWILLFLYLFLRIGLSK